MLDMSKYFDIKVNKTLHKILLIEDEIMFFFPFFTYLLFQKKIIIIREFYFQYIRKVFCFFRNEIYEKNLVKEIFY